MWNTDAVLENIKTAIKKAQSRNVPVVFIQHVAPKDAGLAPFFVEGSEGANIRPDLLSLAPDAQIVVKTMADGFYHTNLESVLDAMGTEKIVVCGMMTQNCVTHTAISKTAEKYQVSIVPECCTTVNEMLHLIALHVVSTSVEFEKLENLFD